MKTKTLTIPMTWEQNRKIKKFIDRHNKKDNCYVITNLMCKGINLSGKDIVVNQNLVIGILFSETEKESDKIWDLIQKFRKLTEGEKPK